MVVDRDDGDVRSPRTTGTIRRTGTIRTELFERVDTDTFSARQVGMLIHGTIT
ncbi:MAG: hypothetical protein NVSMB14_03140 [Isosphaeraceae bacterium]